MPKDKFEFLGLGIGQLLQRYRLAVPPNQRAYAWEERHVVELFQDLNAAIEHEDEDYFLGTVVLVGGDGEELQVADGQQRIATTTLLIARIRDRLYQIGRDVSAKSVDDDFLRKFDRDTEVLIPRLKLNIEDNEFFLRHVLPSSKDPAPTVDLTNKRPSNERLEEASAVASDFIRTVILAGLREELHADRLLAWVKFIEKKATVIAVIAPDDVGAFRMFETLNDRGLRASQADILKNYFFSRAPNRLPEVQMAWNSMNSVIETLGDEEDGVVLYLRHFWITTHGPTKERELAAAIKRETNNETKTLQLVFDLRDAADDYLAVWSHDHQKWKNGGYKASTRKSIQTISDHLKVKQIRPLLFAVARHFEAEEADKAFRLFVSWSVRFLVFGGRGGLLDHQFSLRAQEVGTGKIVKARELRKEMRDYVPTDKEFQEAFATARVSRPYLARYYLRSLDLTMKDDPEPEFVQNEDQSKITLEHVMPLTPNENWNVDLDTTMTAQKLLGNMVLLPGSKNVLIGNASFEQKRKLYAESSYLITSQVAKFSGWGIEEIRERQAEMAKIAVKTWPLTFGQ